MHSAPNTFTLERRGVFFQVLEDTCSPKQAAAAAGVSRATAFYHKVNDPAFRSRWEKAMDIALDALLDEAYRRAALGYEEPVIHAGQLATVTDEETGKQRPLTVRPFVGSAAQVPLWRSDGRPSARQGRGEQRPGCRSPAQDAQRRPQGLDRAAGEIRSQQGGRKWRKLRN